MKNRGKKMHIFCCFLTKKPSFWPLKTGFAMGLAHSKRGSRGPPKPLKMNIFSTFLMIFHQNGLRYRDLRDFGVKKGSILTFFDRFFKKPWVPPGETRKMGHFSGDFQYEIAITFRKVIEKGVRLGVFGRFWGFRSILSCQYPDISHLLGPSYVSVCCFRWYSEKVKKSIKYVQKMGHFKSILSCQYPDISH